MSVTVYTVYILSGVIMAIVKFPALSVDASGNVGNINYTRHRGRSIARAASVPTGTPTQKQIDQRALLTAVSGQWGGVLDADDREAWEEVAKQEIIIDRLGQEYIPSAYQYFMKLNLQAVVFGNTISVRPPAKPEIPYVGSLEIKARGTYLANGIEFCSSPYTMVDADGFEIFRAGPFVSGGRKPIKPEYRFLMLQRGQYWADDYDIIDNNYYFYKVRYFYEPGFIGNFWVESVLSDDPYT